MVSVSRGTLVALCAAAALGFGIGCLPANVDPDGGTGLGSGGSSGGATGGSSGGSSGGTSGGSSTGGTEGAGSGGTTQGSGGAGSGGDGSGSGTGQGSGGAGDGTGGGNTGSGGRASTGGNTGSGGGSGSGGNNGGGGRAGTGGSGSGGNGSGGNGSGGSGSGGQPAATACTLPTHGGNGSFTYYYFGQGTYKEGGGYRTACGYYGTEGGSSKSGPNDTVQNIAKSSPASAMYFAAIPGTNGFNTKDSCGACVQITGQNGKVIIATIADECPYGSDGGNQPCSSNPSGHLDLSTAAFDQLGYSTGNPSGTNWKYVPCPVTGNVILQIKNGNDNEFFVQNTVLAIKGVSRNGENAVHQSYGAWHFNGKLNSGDTLTLTDQSNRTLQVQVTSTAMGQAQDTGTQFPACQ